MSKLAPKVPSPPDPRESEPLECEPAEPGPAEAALTDGVVGVVCASAFGGSVIVVPAFQPRLAQAKVGGSAVEPTVTGNEESAR